MRNKAVNAISTPQKNNRTLAGPVEFVGAGPTFTFQRGTAAAFPIAIWEDATSASDSTPSLLFARRVE
jgi:hypothetical protein